jgi:phosphate transport system substrate-binding protein
MCPTDHGLGGKITVCHMRFVRQYRALLIGLFVFVLGSSAFAEEVMLKLNSGGLTISGNLVEFDGENYLVETEVLGKIRVSKDKFSCLGGGCPQTATNRQDAAPADPKSLRIRGSTTVGLELLPAIIRKYSSEIGATFNKTDLNENEFMMELVDQAGKKLVSIDLKAHGSSNAFTTLAAGESDIGIASRSISDAEIGALARAGYPDMNRPNHEHVIGLDGLMVIVSPRNALSSLTMDEISKIFSGELTDWSQVGGAPGKINVYAKGEKSATAQTFKDLVLKPYKRNISSGATLFEVNADLAKAVAKDVGGIGFVSFAEIGIAKSVSIKDSCGLISNPSEFGVKSGEYPLSRALYLYTTNLTDKYASGIVDYARSSASDELVEETGFITKQVMSVPFDSFRDHVAVSLNAAPEDFDIELMRQLMREFDKGERLSATMRFETVSSQLDSESVQSLSRIVGYIKKQDLSGKKIVVAGYSDATGWFERNKELSLKRAEAARDGLVLASNGEIKPSDIGVRAYSELFPVACNDTERGRYKNRRAEIWLVPTDSTRPVVLTKQP